MKTLTVKIYFVVIVFLTSCAGPGSTPVKYYQLVADTNELSVFDTNNSYLLEPIRIAEILKREPIVSYDGHPNNLILSNTHLWAGDLRELTLETILISLRHQLSQANVKSYSSSSQKIESYYRITIFIQEFYGQLGGESKLRVQWNVHDENKNSVFSKETILNRATSNESYSSYVSTLNQLLIEFTKVMAQELDKLT